ncbi:MAG: VWA domain-containing protein [Acidobacteria bacterium]|nr:VWA domain-containing protein [Acidobacteriota bacterium]
MKHISLALLICLLLLGIAAGQKPTPTPDEDVVKISTSLIQLDVTVTDLKGKPVTDLRPNEVEIYENGQKQKISGFNFVSNVRETATPNPVSTQGGIPVPVPPRTLRADQIHRTIALVVDDLSLDFSSAYYTRRALKKFVDEQMQDGDLVAIIRTGAGIGALQQFTSDKRILYAAIEKVKWNPGGTGGVSAFAPIESTADTSLRNIDPSAQGNSDPNSNSTAQNAIDQGNGSGESADAMRTTIFATGTLGALKYVVNGMGHLPGRKSVILFSNGFALFEKDDDGNPTGSSLVLDYLRELVDQANRAAVTFYTIDARGLQYTGFTAADEITDSNPDTMASQMQSRMDQLLDTQAGLSYLAHETGGFDIKNNNDLSGGVRRVLEDQSYYLVAYEPEGDTFDAKKRKFNQLMVKVLRPNVRVRYRSGFFNSPDAERTASAPADKTHTLAEALVSPFAVSGLDLRMNALFADDPKTGPFVRSLLHVNAKDLNFTDDKDGTKKAVIEILAMSFGDNGRIVDQLAKGYTLSLKAETYQRLLKSGFVYQFTFPVKKPGAYQYRVAIRDATAGTVGSASQFIQVPDLKKKGLTLSSIVLQSISAEEWQGLPSRPGAETTTAAADTALRRVSPNHVLRYGFEIYNSKLDPSKQPRLTMRVRVFRDGKVFYDGQAAPVSVADQSDLQHIKAAGALAIGKTMQPGDYVFQVIVTDSLAKEKQQISTQFVEFEVVP